MDPGLGLIVNSIVPNEIEMPKILPKVPLQLPDGFLEKPNVRHALKYMVDDEQRERALEVAMAWKKRFTAEKWEPVVAAIEAASKEDHVRMPPQDAYLHELHAAVLYPAERSRAMTTASAPAVPEITMQSTPMRAELTRLHTVPASLPLRRTRAPSTPRTYRWDVMQTGPVTPLSPVPLGNAFSETGFWGKSTLQAEHHENSAIIAAVEREPALPIIPTSADVRAIYEKVKSDVDALARKYCLARYRMRSSLSENGFVPATMVRPKDMMEASHVVLEHRQLNLKLAITNDLPIKLEIHAADETALRQQLCIRNDVDLSEQNNWMNDETFTTAPSDLDSEDYSAPVHLAVSILDEQREALRMFRTQRKNNDLQLRNDALEAAWAVRIMEDVERLMTFEADGSSSSGGDDDDGYSYGNFLRSIKSEMSMSTSSGALASMVEELSNSDLTSLRSQANTHQSTNSARSRDFRFPRRSSTSPIKDNKSPARSNEALMPSSNHKSSNSVHRRTELRISTNMREEAVSEELSPEDREFRHRAPSVVDLNNWAEELKKMEAMRADRQRSPTLHRRQLTRFKEPNSYTQQHSSAKDTSVDSTDNHIFPTRRVHSCSSSLSICTNLLKPLPRPLSIHSHPIPLSAPHDDTKHTIHNHQYYQRDISNTSASNYEHDTGIPSMHDRLRRRQYLRSASGLQVFGKGNAEKEKAMENGEDTRQKHETERVSQLLESGEHYERSDEGVLVDV